MKSYILRLPARRELRPHRGRGLRYEFRPFHLRDGRPAVLRWFDLRAEYSANALVPVRRPASGPRYARLTDLAHREVLQGAREAASLGGGVRCDFLRGLNDLLILKVDVAHVGKVCIHLGRCDGIAQKER